MTVVIMLPSSCDEPAQTCHPWPLDSCCPSLRSTFQALRVRIGHPADSSGVPAGMTQ